MVKNLFMDSPYFRIWKSSDGFLINIKNPQVYPLLILRNHLKTKGYYIGEKNAQIVPRLHLTLRLIRASYCAGNNALWNAQYLRGQLRVMQTITRNKYTHHRWSGLDPTSNWRTCSHWVFDTTTPCRDYRIAVVSTLHRRCRADVGSRPLITCSH